MTDSAITSYLKWVEENGGSYNNIVLKDGCVYATDTIAENDSFATMPFKICISDPVAREALPGLEKFSGRVVLSLYLTIEKLRGEKSFYWPYINILPREIRTSLYFNEQDFQYIKNTNLEAATKTRRDELFEEFNQLLNHLPASVDKEKVTWDDYLYCYSMVSSRSFPYRLVDSSAKEGSEAMFPLLDSLNHKPNTKITWSTNNGSVSFVAGQEFKAGQEVFNNYGPKSNEELLIGYGFCFEHNDYDYITLKPNFSQDPNHEIKQHILKNCSIASTNEADPLAFYIHRNNIPNNFLRLMRVLVMNALEIQCYYNCTDTALLDFVGYRNELSMISMVLMLLKNKLFALNSVKIDEENMTECQRYAVIYRKGQEEIYNITTKKMEDMRYNLIKKMSQEQTEKRVVPIAPFLNINNTTFFAETETTDTMEDDSKPTFLTLDAVVITLKQLLNQDAAFSDIISANFEDMEEEMDIVMTLALMKESVHPDSKWKEFFVKVSQSEYLKTLSQNNMDELQEMYESVVPAFAEAYPDVFNLKEFSMQSFILADHILNYYSIDNPLAIVPL